MPTDNIQQILMMWTAHKDPRSDAAGWTAEDPSLYVPHANIGHTRGPLFSYTYPSPLAAMADGWHLLAPPKLDQAGQFGQFEWWFVREVQRGNAAIRTSP